MGGFLCPLGCAEGASGFLSAICVRNKQRLLSRVSCTLKGKVVMGTSSLQEQDEKRSRSAFPPRHHFLWVTLGSGIVCCFPMAGSCEIFYGALVVSHNPSPNRHGWESAVTLAPCGELPQPSGRNILSSYRHTTLHSDFFQEVPCIQTLSLSRFPEPGRSEQHTGCSGMAPGHTAHTKHYHMSQRQLDKIFPAMRRAALGSMHNSTS